MAGCIYRTKDGECDLYSEGGKFHAFCVGDEPCEGRRQTNYDRIISKTPEELAEFICSLTTDCLTKCPAHNLCVFGGGRANGLVRWLKQEAEE